MAHVFSDSQTSTNKKPATHPSFEFIRSEPIASLNLAVEEYHHKNTGARHFHLNSGNPENVFLVAFRTVPMDSSGVAHILEHTTLCGSERYPVRDPFFMMIRRSLNTFMNAFTSSDWTAYPFASQNKKDFGNLLNVYLDATFFSRLHELDFAQEGHRVEFEEADNPDSKLVYKGVVFNEMKGAMSSAISTLWQTLCHYLYPTSTYHYNSGGEPADIPNLNYEDLKNFYRSHYHPSNAVFMTYGDIPAVEHQKQFEERALYRFSRLDKEINISDEQRYTQPLVIEEPYSLEEKDLSSKTHVVQGWLLGKSSDLTELMQCQLMSSVLLDNSASPLRQALETTDLGTAPSPLCGLEESNREMCFVCGVEGAEPENAEKVESLVMNVINDVAKNGIETEKLESVLHQLELQQREVSGDGYPYGLHLILCGLSPAIHGGDPISALNIDPVLEQLRKDIQNPDFIKQLVKKHLIDNQHRVRLTLKPDADLARKKEQQERDRLDVLKESMNDKTIRRVLEQTRLLEQRQNQEDDPEILPKVGLEDIPGEIDEPEGRIDRIGPVPLTTFQQGTNGLVYQQIIIDMPDLEKELLEVLPHYTGCLTELGCGERDYLETQAWQDAVSGGIGASSRVRGSTRDVQDIQSHFIFSGKALARNQEKLTELMYESLENVRFDELDRIREIVAQDRARAEQSITGMGHTLALSAACSGMSPAAALSHRLRGLAGIQSLKTLDDSLAEKKAVNELADKFRNIHERILRSPRQLLIVCEADQEPALRQSLQAYWGKPAQAGTYKAFSQPAIRQKANQLWTTSTDVNFCARSYPTVTIEHEDAAPLTVLAGFLRNGYLHRAIREQGGAYGGGASHDPDIAAFRFYSYRDPRLTETLGDFDASIDWLLNEEQPWRQVEEAILGIVGALDKPGSPAGEAKSVFFNSLYGRTRELREAFRNRVTKVKLEDLKRVGETYLKNGEASTAVITSARVAEQNTDLGLEHFAL